MKMLVISLLLLGYTARAGNTDNPGRNLTNCKFSKTARFNSTITYKNQATCAQKLCMHPIQCNNHTLVFTCPAKDGRCTGYTADECVQKATQVPSDM